MPVNTGSEAARAPCLHGKADLGLHPWISKCTSLLPGSACACQGWLLFGSLRIQCCKGITDSSTRAGQGHAPPFCTDGERALSQQNHEAISSFLLQQPPWELSYYRLSGRIRAPRGRRRVAGLRLPGRSEQRASALINANKVHECRDIGFYWHSQG